MRGWMRVAFEHLSDRMGITSAFVGLGFCVGFLLVAALGG